MSARTASGVKSAPPVDGRKVVDNSYHGIITGDIRGDLTGSGVVGRRCDVTDGGGASFDLADGDSGGGWDCPIGEGCLGRDSETPGRDVGGVVHAAAAVAYVGAWESFLREWTADPLA